MEEEAVPDNGHQPRAAAEHPRPHLLALPFPALGHIKPVLQLCKSLIAKAGCRVTVACCEMSMPFLHQLLPTTPDHMALLPLSNPVPLDVASGGPPTWDTYRTVLRSYYDALPRSLAGHVAGLSDVVCVISDVYLSWAAEVADQLRVPHLAQWTSCAAELQVYLHAKELVRAAKLPFKAPPGTKEKDLDNLLPSLGGTLPQYHQAHGKVEGEEEIRLPGLPGLMRRDFPSLLQIEDTSDVLFSLFVEHVKSSFTASMVLFNSFEALEGRVLDAMRSQGIAARSIGPLFLTEDASLIEKGPSKEQECLKWLDGQKPKSVLYVAFGTVVRLDSAQVRELALGLLNSRQPFIWVCPNSKESGSSKRIEGLPEGFLDQVKDRALLLEWAPQTRILSHPSTGGFLTHCGWNSTMETICHGVPTLCFPFAGDQCLNCKMVVDEWKVGLRLERRGNGNIALAGDIERLTRDLFHEEPGSTVQKRAHELKLAAHDALQVGGSSHQALETILELLK